MRIHDIAVQGDESLSNDSWSEAQVQVLPSAIPGRGTSHRGHQSVSVLKHLSDMLPDAAASLSEDQASWGRDQAGAGTLFGPGDRSPTAVHERVIVIAADPSTV